MNDSSLTAEAMDSAQQDSRVQTEGVRYSFSSWAFCEHFADGSYKFLTPDMDNVELLHRAGELVRRANALPTVEAQLAEAVELLRRIGECYDVSRDMDCHACREEITTFLAKVKP